MTAKNGLGGRPVGLGEADQARTPAFAEKRKKWGTVGGARGVPRLPALRFLFFALPRALRPGLTYAAPPVLILEW